MTLPTNLRPSSTTGTTGTKSRDSGVARGWDSRGLLLVVGLALSACGGESEPADDSTGSDNSSGGNSTGSASSGNGSSATTSEDTGGPSGASTTGTSSGSGAGGNSNTSNNGTDDTSSGGSGGSGGLGGAGGSAGAPGSCEPQDVAGVGNCDAAFGVFFLGDAGCGWVSGCSCEGADCANGYEDEAACEQAHRGCSSACAPQDITLIGSCEPASVYAFNGTECVAMDGCSCVGDDCDQSYASLEECKAANAECAGREQSCDEVSDLYNDYVGHTACSDDSDCVVVSGHCGIGVGGCYHAVNRRWGQAGLDAIAEAWTAADCTGPVCDCASPPSGAYCGAGLCGLPQP